MVRDSNGRTTHAPAYARGRLVPIHFCGRSAMRMQRISSLFVAAIVAIAFFAASASAVTYTVGANPGNPLNAVLIPSGPFAGTPNFVFSADIDYDAGGDTLLKDFTQTSQGGGGPNS